MNSLACFKAYDIRGRVPDELNEDLAYRIGRAFGAVVKPARVVIGRDIRLSSEPIAKALAKGLTDSGPDVFDIGVCGTEQVYFATFLKNLDGGIMVTASHNPIDYNGMKLVQAGARPISGDSGLNEIAALVKNCSFGKAETTGTVTPVNIDREYLSHLLGYVDLERLKPLKVVVNAGNGCAGHIIDLLEKHLPVTFIKINHKPDGTFPNGIPNPLLPENRAATSNAVLEHGADLGIAWDGDFDRSFLFDEQGSFIEGYYIVGLLADALLKKNPGARIIHDPRLTWNTIDIVTAAGGVPIMSKTGHAFIKERMRLEDALYGGEMSAHHYFRDFAYCDSGMIPWLLTIQLMGMNGESLSSMVAERIRLFPASGEINRTVRNTKKVIDQIREMYLADSIAIDQIDGLSMEFDRWRFNLRSSNTEPVLRLNVESKGNEELMRMKTAELLEIIDCG
jgi:phosphomannomutase/phosphomannomutase/phosphoglucomutase